MDVKKKIVCYNPTMSPDRRPGIGEIQLTEDQRRGFDSLIDEGVVKIVEIEGVEKEVYVRHATTKDTVYYYQVMLRGGITQTDTAVIREEDHLPEFLFWAREKAGVPHNFERPVPHPINGLPKGKLMSIPNVKQ